MGTTDHPAWPAYKIALERLARAGVRMEAARATKAPDLDAAEEAFNDAMEGYDAVREQLAEPAPSQFDGVPVLRSWLDPIDLTFPAVPSTRQESGADQA